MFAQPESGQPLSKLVQSGALDTMEGDGFHRIAWLITEALKVPATFITLLNVERYWARSDLDIEAETVLEALKGGHDAIPSSDILEINDARLDPAYFDSPLVLRDKPIRFIACAPILDAAGFACGVVTVLDEDPRKLDQNERSMLRCFTDQVESEMKILTLMQEEADLRFEVSKAFNAKSTFLSQMSHEIRTPIAGIIGATDLMLADQNRDVPELLNTIRTSASDLLQLLNETLDSAKIEAGGLNIQSVPVDLVSFRDKLEHHFSVIAESKGLEFDVELDLASELPEFVYSDPLRLRQILFNVLHNAMKFTESGGVRCTIELLPRDQDALVRMTISDTGIGMTQSEQAVMFEPFRQVDEGDERSFGGSGLGMSMVKQLADRMCGEITVDSTPGSGTSISIELPVKPVNDVWIVAAADEDETLEPSSPVEVVQDEKVKGLQILVADDNPQNRLILEKVLTSWGCEVSTVDDGEEALKLALSHAFDAIILDLHMPRRSGFEVARSIRNYTLTTKLIACSADTTQAAFAKCQDVGFDAKVEKPFNWPKLHQALIEKPQTHSAPEKVEEGQALAVLA